jgi:hypothetical protein
MLAGCGLDEVAIPDLGGPSGTGLLLHLRATPDVLVADGESRSLVQANLYDNNGAPLANQQILFSLIDEATGLPSNEVCFLLLGGEVPFCLGRLEAVTGGIQHSLSIVVQTDSEGVAQVRFVAPFNTQTAGFPQLNGVTVTARPVGNDFNGQFFRGVRIQLINR